jgi:hypothetical protein
MRLLCAVEQTAPSSYSFSGMMESCFRRHTGPELGPALCRWAYLLLATWEGPRFHLEHSLLAFVVAIALLSSLALVPVNC